MLAIWILLFITGAAIGSFLNVCIYRLPAKQSIVSPPSHCHRCNHRLGFWELIPIFSYLFLQGRCKSCRVKISTRYLMVELITGIAFVIFVMVFGFNLQSLSYILLFCALLTASLIDFDHRIIPDEINLFLILTGLLLQGLQSFDALVSGIIGGLMGGGLLLVIAVLSRGGLGGGDIKLVTGIGVFLGWKLLLVSLFVSFILGSLVGIAWVLFKNKGLKTAVPFGPFLSIGAIIAVFYGQQIIATYLSYF
ncbi:prepilin peptidase [Desulforamulus putei]|uniref:prepilin peptidase n=1 Tax=Desulforamulus putei TaxID=74701 RepID=UPI002FDC8946